MDVSRNGKAWAIGLSLAIALPFVAGVLVLVGIEYIQTRPASVDEAVGTLRFDELSVALATDADREVERIVGHVWRLEGPKSTLRGHGRYYFFAVDLGTSDGIANRLYLDTSGWWGWDDSRFEAEEVPIVCLITSARISNNAPDDPSHVGERSIAAKSCGVVDPGTNPVSDSP